MLLTPSEVGKVLSLDVKAGWSFQYKKIELVALSHMQVLWERGKGTWCDVAESNITKLDLAFDVHFLES